MAYKIQYKSGDDRRYPIKQLKRKRRYSSIIFACFILIALLSGSLFRVYDKLLPAELQSTKIATLMLLETLKEGKSIEDAVLVFCRQIIGEKS